MAKKPHLKVGDYIFDRDGDDLYMKFEAMERRIDKLEEQLASLKSRGASEAPKSQ